MRTEIDTANIEPEKFAAQIARWLELLERPGEPTPKMRDARAAASNALPAELGSTIKAALGDDFRSMIEGLSRVAHIVICR